MIEREVFDWGVRLTARPFKRTKIQTMVIRSEVGLYKPGRGCGVRITFSAASFQSALQLIAQTWNEGMAAIINETRSVMADRRPRPRKPNRKRSKPHQPSVVEVARVIAISTTAAESVRNRAYDSRQQPAG